MKFRMFTDAVTQNKVAVNVDHVIDIVALGNGKTYIWFDVKGQALTVAEDFDTVFSRLNTIAE